MDRMHAHKNLVILAAATILFLFCVKPVSSATYYVRVNGGTPTQCNGLYDADYPGSGTNQNCAFNHPSWVQAPQGSPTILQGGDTLIIDGSNGAEYMIGYNAPNSSGTDKCHPAWPYDCYWRKIPSGPDPANPTRILGKGWDTGCDNPPQLWANERLDRVINLDYSDNIELQCLEITDHSDCQEHGPNACNRTTSPYGPWGKTGIKAADSENVLLKNINVHGMAFKGIHAGRLKDWTVEDTRFYANSFVGWDGDIGANNSSNSGTMTFNRTSIEYSGCGETYPGEQPYNCYGQGEGGYGDGLATATSGGNWVFNEVDFSHNVQDGLDLLYLNSSSTVSIKRSRFEGNGGNQAKVAADTTLENSVVIGNCNYFRNNPMAANPNGISVCRALGNALVFAYHPGMVAEFFNSTLVGYGDVIILTTPRTSCDGSERLISHNNIFLATDQYGHPDVTALFYADPGSDPDCGEITLEDEHSIIWGTKRISTDCDGKLNTMCEDPRLNQLVEGTWYTGDNFDASLKSSSPGIGQGKVLTGKSDLDYKKKKRGSVWDIGAIEFDIANEDPSCTENIDNCTTEADCVAEGYYWYNDVCNVDPEPLPSCADDILYCSTESECTGQGFHWYNNTCNYEPESEPDPTCAQSILYCTTSGECTSNGYHWYDNSCHAGPQPQPTCADGIQYCTNSSDCIAQGHYWYNNTCNSIPEPEPTCADGIQYCTTSAECVNNGYHWYDNHCHSEPEPLPTCADGIQYCTTSAECTSNGHYWYDNACHLVPEPVPTCADGIQYCSSSAECEGQGYHWYNNVCNLQPEPEPTCADGIQYCSTWADCETNGYYWYDNSCHSQPEPVPTCADDISLCVTSTDCIIGGHYWYDNACHLVPEPAPTCADDIQYCTKQKDCVSQGYEWSKGSCRVPVDETKEEDDAAAACAESILGCTTTSLCEGQGYYWYKNSCHVVPKAHPKDQQNDSLSLNTTETESLKTDGSTPEDEIVFLAQVEPDITDSEKKNSTSNGKTKTTDDGSANLKGPKPKESGSGSGGGAKKGGAGGGGAPSSDFEFSSGDTTTTESASSTGSGGIGTISGPVESTVTTSTGSGSDSTTSTTTFTVTENNLTDLESESYEEIEEQLAAVNDAAAESTEGEGEASGESESSDPDLAEGTEEGGEEQSAIESLQEGVKKVWDGVVKWFRGIGNNK